MTYPAHTRSLDFEVESHIDAFEESLESDPNARWADFLPKRTHPKFLRVAAELVRVDMELSWSDGRHRFVTDYERELPELTQDDSIRAELVFEEYRQRQTHGRSVSVHELAQKYQVSSAGWSTVVNAKDRTATTAPFTDLAEYVPVAGQRWRDFEILREIGRGAQSRVMLARQTSLSGREVVLKFAPKHDVEAEKLARLQHPQIVAVFSVYEDQHFHVFCMPYLGESTLADLDLPLREFEALGIIEKLASAIAHAHHRGILHHDLKPANALLVDGDPMLLDFNLAADVTGSVETLQIGGTLPYMSPESLRAMLDRQTLLDKRSDIFSLGVLLFWLLTGRTPFDHPSDFESALASRESPHLDPLENTSVGVAAIVRKCLAPQPMERYQSADDLVTDIRRHAAHQALQFAPNGSTSELFVKWCRRHPRLSSITSVAAVASLVLITVAFAWHLRETHVQGLEAVSSLAAFQQKADRIGPELAGYQLQVVDLATTVEHAVTLLTQYVDKDDQWQTNAAYRHLPDTMQQTAAREIAELSFLTATGYSRLALHDSSHLQSALRWNAIAQQAYGQSRRSTLFQLAVLQSLAEDDRAKSTFQASKKQPLADPTDMHFMARLQRYRGDSIAALEHLKNACDAEPTDFLKWFDRAMVHVDLRQWQDAEQCLTTSLALRPYSVLAVYARAMCRHERGKFAESVEDYSRALAYISDDSIPEQPEHGEVPMLLNPACCLLNRAIAYKAAGKLKPALDDLNQAIDLGYDSTRPLLIRSRVRRELGDLLEAGRDYRRALTATPRDELGWVARGVARMQREPQKAVDDFEQAVKLNPRSHSARRNLSYVLSERLDDTNTAIHWLDELIADYPSDGDSIGGRGVLLARMGQFDRAIADAKRIAELNHASPRAVLQAACVYSMASTEEPKWKKTAVDLVGLALKMDPDLARIAQVDGDLKAIHKSEAFLEVCRAGRQLAAIPEATQVIQRGEQQ